MKNSGKAALGISLIEIGVAMVFLSIALVPVVKMIGGPTNATGNASRVTGLRSKEVILANTLIEQGLARNFTVINCGGTTTLPQGTTPQTYSRCMNKDYNKPMYYQWTVRNVGVNNGGVMPSGNQLFLATLNIYDTSTGGTPTLTLPTYFFNNYSGWNKDIQKTGILLTLDTSGSMQQAKADPPALANPSSSNGCVYSTCQDPTYAVALPFMYYRYNAAKMTAGGLPANTLNIWDNTQLDLVYGRQIGNGAAKDPDDTTPYNEAFPYPGPATPGLLGMGNCTQTATNWAADNALKSVFTPYGQSGAPKSVIASICAPKASQAAWSNTVNTNLSRIEALRTAAISLILNMESNPNITPHLHMGLVAWNSTPTLEVPLEKSAPVAAAGNQLRFAALRNRLLWINRADPSSPASTLPIKANGGTQIDLAMRASAQELRAQTLDQRIMVLITDGDPDPATGTNTAAALKAYALSIGKGEPNPDKQITIFTVGLINADQALMRDIALNTPNGDTFFANDITELSAIFQQIAYQTQKLALLNQVERYGVKL